MANKERRLTLLVDVDGTLNSYTSKYQKDNPNHLDPPVDGAIQALRRYIEVFDVYLFSTRFLEDRHRPAQNTSTLEEAVAEVKKWLFFWGMPLLEIDQLKFTAQKVPCFMIIDDRGYHFQGVFPSVEEIKRFKPWDTKDLWEPST